MKDETKVAARACAVARLTGIMAAALVLSGCAVAMLGGAARSGGSQPASSGSTTPAERPAASDSSISMAVRARFGANSALKPLKIAVDTHDGVVTLRGQVNTVEQRNAAQAEARVVSGVQSVSNQLTVR